MLMEVDMALTPLEEVRLKDLLKTAIIEVFEERKDLLRDVLQEALEDMALARAIEEGAGGVTVSRDEVFAVLEGSR